MAVCGTCRGSGKIPAADENGLDILIDCPNCGGKGFDSL